MDNTVNNISNSWSLMAFARKFGKMQVGKFVSKDTGDEFMSTVFTHPTRVTAEGKPERVFAGFARKLGVLSPAEIARRKNELQVVQMKDTGNYVLCTMGGDSWQDVDLGL